MADYVPGDNESLLPWLTNLKTKIPNYATGLSITPTRQTQIIAWCDTLLASLQKVSQKKNEWLAATADKDTQYDASIGGLRGEIGKWKADDGMTDAIAADLQIVGGGNGFNPETFKAAITAQAFGGYVRIKFKKGQTDGIILNSRLKGVNGWKFVSRDTNSPYDDYTPLTTAGSPEVREYQAYGVLNDKPIGQPSDIVAVTFGG